MKTFRAKVVVKLKPTIIDSRGQVLKKAIESLFRVENLVCRVGTSYSLEFDARDQVDALTFVEHVAQDLLYNEVTEFYEIRSLDEV